MNGVRGLLLLGLAAVLPACGISGGGTLTPTVSPAAPPSVAAKIGNKRVVLSWTPSPAASHYLVRRSRSPGGPYADLPESAGLTATTFIDTAGLTNGQTYYYVVDALNSFGQSTDSLEVSATPGFAGAVIAAGAHHSHAVLQDGSLWSWGINLNGSLGDGSSRPLSTVAVPVDLPGATALEAGLGHVLALMADGSVWGWGYNDSGQLGINSQVHSFVPVRIPGLSGVIQIAAGDLYSLALLADGTVRFWGLLEGVGSPDSLVPVPVPGLDNVVQIAAGSEFALALRADGTVRAWGKNSQGRLGTGSLSPSPSPSPLPVVNLTGITTICAGTSHSIALRSDGTAWAWGNNLDGRLGAVTPLSYSPIPVQVTGLSGAMAVAAGNDHSVALRADGKVVAWGKNNVGQVGSGTLGVAVTVPTLVPGLSGIIAISTFTSHTLAMDSGGGIWAWGDNSYGELGSGTGATQNLPVEVSNLTSVSSVAGGWNHSLAARTDGTVWAWGDNASGQLGIAASATTSNYRVQVTGLPAPDVTEVAAGNSYSLFRRSNGTVYACGLNTSGQLGINNSGVTGSSTPTQVVTLLGTTPDNTIVNMAAGSAHVLAIAQSKIVWAWGSNTSGQIGNNSSAAAIDAPAQVSGMTNVIGVAAGRVHSLAVRGDGTVWAWGDNSHSELGNAGVVGLSKIPVPVSGFSGAVAVAAADGFSLAMKGDGSVWAWGSGFLGIGAYFSSVTPVPVPAISGAAGISAGEIHVYVRRASGTVMAWGLNQQGAVGDGSLIPVYSPVAVADLPGAVSVSAGGFHGLAIQAGGTVRAWGYNASGQIGIGSNGFSITPILVTH